MGKIGHDKRRLGGGLQAERQSNQEKDGKSRKESAKWDGGNKGDEEVQRRIAFLSQKRLVKRKPESSGNGDRFVHTDALHAAGAMCHGRSTQRRKQREMSHSSGFVEP
ncbi:hypothetical protein ROHU_007155 [Labeo rohita]|nr:hypothetical protein ROHU_007155 [Labeo rohita]